jgi:hypothetical protein
VYKIGEVAFASSVRSRSIRKLDRNNTGSRLGRNSLLDHVVQCLLLEIAGPLLRAGFTPKRFGQLATLAFVRAASEGAVLLNGRVNQSRVAVSTGLSRREVRELLSNVPRATRRMQPRSTRVMLGWMSDQEFLTKLRKPKVLPLHGSNSSFALLVKKHGGDVPTVAVLTELRRLGAVSETKQGVKLRLRSLSV